MKTKILVLALLSVLLTSCGTNGTSNTQTQTTVGTTAAETTQTLTEAATQTTAAETTTAETTVATETTALAIATGDDVIATDAVGFVGMEAISAAQIKDYTTGESIHLFTKGKMSDESDELTDDTRVWSFYCAETNRKYRLTGYNSKMKKNVLLQIDPDWTEENYSVELEKLK